MKCGGERGSVHLSRVECSGSDDTKSTGMKLKI